MKKLLTPVSVAAVSASILLVAGYMAFDTAPPAAPDLSMTEESRYQQLDSKLEARSGQPIGQQTEPQKMSGADKLEQEFRQMSVEIDQLLADHASAPVPAEYQDNPDQRAEIEALIAQVEKDTGQTFEASLEDYQIDPETQKAHYELDQKFKALEKELQQASSQF